MTHLSDYQSNSLDPRLRRLGINPKEESEEINDVKEFSTFEAFYQPKEGKPFEHTGIVHAPTSDMAFLFAKEQFARRGLVCNAMCIVPTSEIYVGPYAISKEDNIFELTIEAWKDASVVEGEKFIILGQKKRGRQHIIVGEVEASNLLEALKLGLEHYGSQPFANLWLVKAEEFLFTDQEDSDIWSTLIDKKYRDAAAYKSQDKIDRFKKEALQ